MAKKPTSNTTPVQEIDAEQNEVLQNVIRSLNPDDPDHFDEKGKPFPALLTEMCGFPVDAELRDASWELLKDEIALRSDKAAAAAGEPDVMFEGMAVHRIDFREGPPLRVSGGTDVITRVWIHKKTGTKCFEKRFANQNVRPAYPFDI